ncbi:MAG: hypothetical protein RIR26_156 [Pseudomonadota bacterium]
MTILRMLQIQTAVLLFASSNACIKKAAREVSSSPDSLIDPHVLPEKGPWFEGWYVRITPASGTDRSFGAIVGSYLPPQKSRYDAESVGLPGYVSILDSGFSGSSLRAYEEFPSTTRMFSQRSNPVERDPLPRTPASFRWTADGLGELTEESVNLRTKDGIELKAKWAGGEPWNKSLLGPEGFISLFRAFPLHWFVYSLSSFTTFEVRVPNPSNPSQWQNINGTGFVHFEKNWGVSFPQSYVWMQASDPQTDKRIALAGGRPFNVAGIQPEAWLIGYRSERFQQDFAPQNVGTTFKSDVNACKGQFSLVATSLNRKIVLEATADRTSFGGIAIPKNSGFEKNGSEQSFQTDVVVRLFEVNSLFGITGGERLLEEASFRSGALEFGGSYKCPTAP